LLKQNNVSYKSDLALLTEKLRHLEDHDESFRNVSTLNKARNVCFSRFG
jgi:hypothetical protein